MKIDGNFVIDTNILLYALNKDSGYFAFSRGMLESNQGNIFLAHKSLTEFVGVLSKLGRYDIIEKELIKIVWNLLTKRLVRNHSARAHHRPCVGGTRD